MTSHEAGGEELSRVLEIGDWAGACLVTVLWTLSSLGPFVFKMNSLQVRLHLWLGL